MIKIKNKKLRFVITFLAVLLSALLQTFVIESFVQTAGLLSGGFTGVAILIDRVAALFGGAISTSVALVALNLPVAFLCYRSISPRFTLFSCLQVILTSLFLKILTFPAIFDDILLNAVFGGFLMGISVVLALKGNASTGGTDFNCPLRFQQNGKVHLVLCICVQRLHPVRIRLFVRLAVCGIFHSFPIYLHENRGGVPPPL